jgi:hypothetical protein
VSHAAFPRLPPPEAMATSTRKTTWGMLWESGRSPPECKHARLGTCMQAGLWRTWLEEGELVRELFRLRGATRDKHLAVRQHHCIAIHTRLLHAWQTLDLRLLVRLADGDQRRCLHKYSHISQALTSQAFMYFTHTHILHIHSHIYILCHACCGWVCGPRVDHACCGWKCWPFYTTVEHACGTWRQ